MGLIKAVTSTVTSTIAEMWEDYIYCDSMSNDILIQKGIARKAGGNEKTGGNYTGIVYKGKVYVL